MHFRLITTLFTFIIMMNPLLVCAVEPEPNQNTPLLAPLLDKPQLSKQPQDAYSKRGFVDEILDVVDNQHQSLSAHIVGFTENIDTFFTRDDQESRVNYSHVQLGYRYTHYTTDPYLLEPVLNARLHLPRTEKKLTLEISNNSPFDTINGEAVNASAGSTSPIDQNETDTALKVGLGYVTDISKLFSTKLKGGGKWSGNRASIFVNLELYRQFFFDKWSLRLSEDLYRDNIIFSRATSQILFERKIDEEKLFRSISKNIYYKDLSYSQYHQTFYVLDQLSKHDAIIYQVGAMWEKQHSLLEYKLDNYYTMIRYSRMIYKDWLFMEISPQVQYLESENFHPKPLLALQFSAFFGNN